MPDPEWLYHVCNIHNYYGDIHDDHVRDDDGLGVVHADASLLQISYASEHLCQTVWPTLLLASLGFDEGILFVLKSESEFSSLSSQFSREGLTVDCTHCPEQAPLHLTMYIYNI